VWIEIDTFLEKILCPSGIDLGAFSFYGTRCQVMIIVFFSHPLASFPMGTRGCFLEIKRPGREADRSPPFSAEVKNALSYTSILPIRLHGVVLG
jgi:hypothetical protein